VNLDSGLFDLLDDAVFRLSYIHHFWTSKPC
jgi:hypothetical protein